MKVIFESTYVRYEEDDALGPVMAFFTLFPIYVMVMFTALILLRRDFSTVLATVGMLVNLLVNKILKVYISQPRPEESDLSGHGMPSNHSQVMGYVLLFYSLQFLLNSPKLPRRQRVLFTVEIFLLTVIVCYSRVYLVHHTVEQVIAGALAGGVVGALWFLVDYWIGDRAGRMLCTWKVFRFLGVHHYSPLEEYLSLRRLKTA